MNKNVYNIHIDGIYSAWTLGVDTKMTKQNAEKQKKKKKTKKTNRSTSIFMLSLSHIFVVAATYWNH